MDITTSTNSVEFTQDRFSFTKINNTSNLILIKRIQKGILLKSY